MAESNSTTRPLDAPPPSACPAMDAALLRRRIILIQTEQPETLADMRLPALLALGAAPLILRTPATVAGFIEWFCGVGAPAEPTISAMLMEQARQCLSLPSPAESLTERAWQLETADPAPELARLLLSAPSTGATEAVVAALRALRDRGLSDVERFEQVVQLLLPARRAIVALPDRDADEWVTLLTFIVHAAERVDSLRLIAIVPQMIWTSLQSRLDPHTRALLEDGQTIWPAATAAISGNAEVGGLPSPSAPAVALPALQRQARAAANAALRASPVSEELSGQARSLAEALLAAALDNDPRTAGLFALNADGGFDFGCRRAEIDLFCAAHGIAVEVDGYFHFQDKQAYRRDRAKDWLMQRQEHLVLRFLAEDVVDRIDAIVDVVADAVALRRSISRPTRPNGELHGKRNRS